MKIWTQITTTPTPNNNSPSTQTQFTQNKSLQIQPNQIPMANSNNQSTPPSTSPSQQQQQQPLNPSDQSYLQAIQLQEMAINNITNNISSSVMKQRPSFYRIKASFGSINKLNQLDDDSSAHRQPISAQNDVLQNSTILLPVQQPSTSSYFPQQFQQQQQQQQLILPQQPIQRTLSFGSSNSEQYPFTQSNFDEHPYQHPQQHLHQQQQPVPQLQTNLPPTGTRSSDNNQQQIQQLADPLLSSSIPLVRAPSDESMGHYSSIIYPSQGELAFDDQF
jgi:hypothetical protein